MFYTCRGTVSGYKKKKTVLILSVIMATTIDAGHSIRYNKRRYSLLDESGIQCGFHKGTKVLVISKSTR